MSDDVTTCQAALWFASRGFPVLPLHSVTNDRNCTCGKPACESRGKHPYAPLAPHGLKDASVDVAVVREWFRESYWLNYGITTDRLLTIDVDARHGGLETWAAMRGQPTRALPHTWAIRTGGQGLHVIFMNTAKVRNGSIDQVVWICVASVVSSSASAVSTPVATHTDGFHNVARRTRHWLSHQTGCLALSRRGRTSARPDRYRSGVVSLGPAYRMASVIQRCSGLPVTSCKIL